MSKEYYLTIQCPDGPGIIAAVTHAIATSGGNIVDLSQHSARDIGQFFLKSLFEVPDSFSEKGFTEAFSGIADSYSMKWKLEDRAARKKIAILVSKTSHCLYELLLKHKDSELECDIAVVISNHPDLAEVARGFGVDFHVVDPSKGKAAYEADMEAILGFYSVDLVVMARYMQILSADFTRRWEHRVINIHHGFLPAFMGAKPYHQAWFKGVKLIGATAHFANENLDQGPIIAQDTLKVSDTCSISEFIRLGKDLERKVLYEAIKLYLERSIFVAEGRTFIL
jgi:formyltetrahydrofolate deformylase